jgi:hypothetical protein
MFFAQQLGITLALKFIMTGDDSDPKINED